MIESFKYAKLNMSNVVKKIYNLKKRSNCWLFFTKTDRGGVCRLCQRTVTSNGNTTNLLNHLKRNHAPEWKSTLGIADNFDFSDEEQEEDKSSPLHRCEILQTSNETAQPPGLAYQSSDGRTVIWLHPDVQEQFSGTGLQPQITVVGEDDDSAPETASLDIEQKSSDNSLLSDIPEEPNFDDIQTITNGNFKTSLHMPQAFLVNSDEVIEGETAVTTLGEECQIVTVVTSTEEPCSQTLSLNSVPKVTSADIVSSIPSIPLSKVIVSHASSLYKSKKDYSRSKKRCKRSYESEGFDSSSKKKGKHSLESEYLDPSCKKKCKHSLESEDLDPSSKKKCNYNLESEDLELSSKKMCRHNLENEDLDSSLKKKCKHSLEGEDLASSSKKKCKHSQESNHLDPGIKKKCRHNLESKEDSLMYQKEDQDDYELDQGFLSARPSREIERLEDSFDHFGKYLATLLRNLPSRRSAYRLQKDMISLVLKEQMIYET